MNIKFRLAEEGELEEGAARGHTLQFLLEKGEVLLEEEEEEEDEGGKEDSGRGGTKPCTPPGGGSVSACVETPGHAPPPARSPSQTEAGP